MKLTNQKPEKLKKASLEQEYSSFKVESLAMKQRIVERDQGERDSGLIRR